MELKMNVPALQRFLLTEFPQVSGELQVISVTEDALSLRLKVQDHHLRPGGTVSGPTMFMLADVAVYLAILSRIGPVALAVTTSCAIDFMRKPAAAQDLVCEAKLLKVGRVLAVGDALIYSAEQDKPVARASMTYSMPPKE